MDITTAALSAIDWTGQGLAVGVSTADFQENGSLGDHLQALDQALGGLVQELVQDVEFTGKLGSSAVSRVRGANIRKLMLVGLGDPSAITLETLRRSAAIAVRLAAQERCETLGIQVPIVTTEAATAQALAEGSRLALYRDDRFRSEVDPLPPLNHVTFLGLGDQAAALTLAQQLCEGVSFARQLVAAPANSLNPVTFADAIAALAQDHGLELQILEREECEARGMGAFLGVAQASDLPPKFVHLIYKPEGTPRRKLAIVGKGLTFDSGGLNLKVGNSSIDMMKTDMGGAGATFGAAKAIALLRPDVEVHFISAITENMVSGRAMRPGDVLTASNGKTIEVNNTDAEGRLTLADALVYADQLGADAMVDLATLTGACVVALGGSIAGLWSPDDDLAAGLLTAAEQSGEKLWRMPMESPYFESMKSVVADMKNTGARAGGAISAALFLQQYVETTPWAHLDVAGPVWTDKEDGYNPVGATGYGVRTLVNWVLA
ncbi:MAG: leucyl aminopeptidase [Prochlorothrix sp.]|nr:leucyl aminopeptidase [Prochlorothrix sp.]